MNIYSENKNLILDGVEDFNIEDILECGQCFNFVKLDNMDYELVAKGKYLHISQRDSVVTMYNTTAADYENTWKSYFDMETDYTYIKECILQADGRLADAIYAKPGIRILRQDFFETLISFIISQNKQIPQIKQVVKAISEACGSKIEIKDRCMFAFPDKEALKMLSEDRLRQCKVGFRAPYIIDAVNRVCEGSVNEEILSLKYYESMADMGEADSFAGYTEYVKNKLMEIKGVGEKVASCVMLFGLGIVDSFPVDVWMKRIMEEMYFNKETKKEEIESFALEKFKNVAGYAQQYLFYYGREKGIGLKK